MILACPKSSLEHGTVSLSIVTRIPPREPPLFTQEFQQGISYSISILRLKFLPIFLTLAYQKF